jgi:hypothetical protein
MSQEILKRWPRSRAAVVRNIIQEMGLCSCGYSHWEVVRDLLSYAGNREKGGRGFSVDAKTELLAKFLDASGLLDHGCSIAFAWLSDDGQILLDFFNDFGTEEHDFNTGLGHPEWSVEVSWKGDANDATDSYARWANSLQMK